MNKIILGVLLFIVYIILLVSSRFPLITDDVSPVYTCPEMLAKSDVLYITPHLLGANVSMYPEWCETIRSLNKTIGLHGITHSYHEFENQISSEKIIEARREVEECSGKKVELFRPPYNTISEENRKEVKEAGMRIYKTRYFVHPYCHCGPQSKWIKVMNWLAWC